MWRSLAVDVDSCFFSCPLILETFILILHTKQLITLHCTVALIVYMKGRSIIMCTPYETGQLSGTNSLEAEHGKMHTTIYLIPSDENSELSNKREIK